jgi:tRNA (guanine-N7-)-methyltransferase
MDIKGARLWKGAKYAEEHKLDNVGFIRTRIEFIESLFAPGEVSEIWITFADPQIGREKKRLTAPLFMNRYRNFLKEGGIIHLKTDSRYLHEYSRAMAEQNGLKVLACATDIYGVDRERLYESGLSSLCGRDAVDALFEVQTFYEAQYLAQGFEITYLSFVADHEGEYISPEWDEDRWKDEGHHFVIPSGLAVASKFYPEG